METDAAQVLPAPALVGIAHGTNAPAGQAAVATLMRAVAAAAPRLNVALGFVDVQQPDTPATLGALPPRAPAVIVPLLLSAGFHVHVDLTDAVRDATDRAVTLGGALGPDDRLVALLRRRLTEAGLTPHDVLVLAAAGSSDARAVTACRVVADRLAEVLGRPVRIGFLSAAEPRLVGVIEAARREHPGHRVVLSSYLLAPGYFQGLAQAAGADLVTAPLLQADAPAPRELVEVVLERYRVAAHPSSPTPPTAPVSPGSPASPTLPAGNPGPSARVPRGRVGLRAPKIHLLRGARRRVTADDRA